MKLAVGAESIAGLEAHIAARLHLCEIAGQPVEQIHTTRMVPKRVTELLDGGSLFWVIKGQLCARQHLLDLRPFTDTDGIGRCHLVLEPIVHAVLPRPCRPFQGWRYLAVDASPPDLAGGLAEAAEMPEQMRYALRDLCLI
jgi:hypothetical protein